MTIVHALMGVGNIACKLEDDRVEQNEAHLLEQAAAELLRLLDRHDKNGVGKTGERALRFVSEQDDLGVFALGDPGKADADRSLPDPETMTRPSPLRMEGAVGSPTTCASRPRCMNRIAAI